MKNKKNHQNSSVFSCSSITEMNQKAIEAISPDMSNLINNASELPDPNKILERNMDDTNTIKKTITLFIK